MMKQLEIDGRIVTVYPKTIEINGEEVVTQGEIWIELQPEVWVLGQIEASSESEAGSTVAAAVRPAIKESQAG